MTYLATQNYQTATIHQSKMALLQGYARSFYELNTVLSAMDNEGHGYDIELAVDDADDYNPDMATFVSLQSPVKNPLIFSAFGHRGGRRHSGIDFSAPIGTGIYAAESGTVIQSGWHYGYGYMVTVQHPDGLQTRYAHCSRMLVKEGDYVRRGEMIAKVGMTGRSTGPHLHFELLASGKAVNPERFLDNTALAYYAPLKDGKIDISEHDQKKPTAFDAIASFASNITKGKKKSEEAVVEVIEEDETYATMMVEVVEDVPEDRQVMILNDKGEFVPAPGSPKKTVRRVLKRVLKKDAVALQSSTKSSIGSSYLSSASRPTTKNKHADKKPAASTQAPEKTASHPTPPEPVVTPAQENDADLVGPPAPSQESEANHS